MNDFYQGSPRPKQLMDKLSPNTTDAKSPNKREDVYSRQAELDIEGINSQLVDNVFTDFCKTIQKSNESQSNALVTFAHKLASVLRSLKPLLEYRSRLVREHPPAHLNLSRM